MADLVGKEIHSIHLNVSGLELSVRQLSGHGPSVTALDRGRFGCGVDILDFRYFTISNGAIVASFRTGPSWPAQKLALGSSAKKRTSVQMNSMKVSASGPNASRSRLRLGASQSAPSRSRVTRTLPLSMSRTLTIGQPRGLGTDELALEVGVDLLAVGVAVGIGEVAREEMSCFRVPPHHPESRCSILRVVRKG
jgi:hypothetical protein